MIIARKFTRKKEIQGSSKEISLTTCEALLWNKGTSYLYFQQKLAYIFQMDVANMPYESLELESKLSRLRLPFGGLKNWNSVTIDNLKLINNS